MGPTKFVRRALHVVRNPRISFMRRIPTVMHVGHRALSRRVKYSGAPCVKKTYRNIRATRQCLEREILADQRFRKYNWKVPVVATGSNWLLTPLLPSERRLDVIAGSLSSDARLEIAKQAIGILFDMFCEGFAHRDFHAGNLFWVDEELHLVDFEYIAAYPSGEKPSFPTCYDLTGQGFDTWLPDYRMCFVSDDAQSLRNTVRVPVEVALEQFEESLKERLH